MMFKHDRAIAYFLGAENRITFSSLRNTRNENISIAFSICWTEKWFAELEFQAKWVIYWEYSRVIKWKIATMPMC